MIVVAAAAAPGDVGGDGIQEHAQFGRLAETRYNGGIKAGSAKNMVASATTTSARAGSTGTCGRTRATPTSASGASPTGRPATPGSARTILRHRRRGHRRTSRRKPTWVSRAPEPDRDPPWRTSSSSPPVRHLAGHDIAVAGIQTAAVRATTRRRARPDALGRHQSATPVQIGYYKTHAARGRSRV